MSTESTRGEQVIPPSFSFRSRSHPDPHNGSSLETRAFITESKDSMSDRGFRETEIKERNFTPTTPESNFFTFRKFSIDTVHDTILKSFIFRF